MSQFNFQLHELDSICSSSRSRLRLILWLMGLVERTEPYTLKNPKIKYVMRNLKSSFFGFGIGYCHHSVREQHITCTIIVFPKNSKLKKINLNNTYESRSRILKFFSHNLLILSWMSSLFILSILNTLNSLVCLL